MHPPRKRDSLHTVSEIVFKIKYYIVEIVSLIGFLALVWKVIRIEFGLRIHQLL